MREFDIVYTQEDINDKCKTTNKSITVTITLGEHRMLVEENTRLRCDVERLFEQINEANRKIEELKKQCQIIT